MVSKWFNSSGDHGIAQWGRTERLLSEWDLPRCRRQHKTSTEESDELPLAINLDGREQWVCWYRDNGTMGDIYILGLVSDRDVIQG